MSGEPLPSQRRLSSHMRIASMLSSTRQQVPIRAPLTPIPTDVASVIFYSTSLNPVVLFVAGRGDFVLVARVVLGGHFFPAYHIIMLVTTHGYNCRCCADREIRSESARCWFAVCGGDRRYAHRGCACVPPGSGTSQQASQTLQLQEVPMDHGDW